jgi:hypothetical protein
LFFEPYKIRYTKRRHVKWAPDIELSSDISNEESRTSNKEWSSSLGFGHGAMLTNVYRDYREEHGRVTLRRIVERWVIRMEVDKCLMASS